MRQDSKSWSKDGMKKLMERLDVYIEAHRREIEQRKDKPDDRLPEVLENTVELKKRVKEPLVFFQDKKNGTLSPWILDSAR
jgi:hypothetical protein